MKSLLSFCFLFVCFSAFAQQTPYQAFEVDSAAVPRGGIQAFNTFLQANLQKPIIAESKGIGGIIVLSGVVEPDGYVSAVKIIKSIRPDCDREAVRVFSLFRAWKPAQKGGKAVRQQVSMPVVFKANPPFTYEHGEKITYLDADVNLLPDSNERVKFKQVNPIDTSGLPTGDLLIYKFNTNQWDEYVRDSLVHQKTGRTDLSGKPTYFLGHQQALLKLNDYLYTVDASGKLIAANYYKTGNLFGPQLTYHPNGVVAEKKEYTPNKQIIISWYSNGQIRHIQEITQGSVLEKTFASALIDKVSAFWDSTGRQLVKNGNGQAQYDRIVVSKRDKSRETSFTEQGAYKNFVKQGTWTGRYADNSHFYEEEYDKGSLLVGKSWAAGQDTTTYGMEDQPPSFPGGKQGLTQFLNQNLRYPENARQARAQGEVAVSFVVCTDGTLCDYEVVKSVDSALDREAMRVVKKMSGLWKPGVHGGKQVRVKYIVPVNFSLY